MISQNGKLWGILALCMSGCRSDLLCRTGCHKIPVPSILSVEWTEDKSDFSTALSESTLAVCPSGYQWFLFYFVRKVNHCNFMFTIYSQFLSDRSSMISFGDPSTFYKGWQDRVIPCLSPYISGKTVSIYLTEYRRPSSTEEEKQLESMDFLSFSGQFLHLFCCYVLSGFS